MEQILPKRIATPDPTAVPAETHPCATIPEAAVPLLEYLRSNHGRGQKAGCEPALRTFDLRHHRTLTRVGGRAITEVSAEQLRRAPPGQVPSSSRRGEQCEVYSD